MVLGELALEYTDRAKQKCFCCCSVAESCRTLSDPMDCNTVGFPCPSQSPGVWSIELVILSNHFILCYPLFLLPSIFPRKNVNVKVAQSCLTLCNPMDYTVLGLLQARIVEWVALPFSRRSSQPRGRTQVSRIAGGFFTS